MLKYVLGGVWLVAALFTWCCCRAASLEERELEGLETREERPRAGRKTNRD